MKSYTACLAGCARILVGSWSVHDISLELFLICHCYYITRSFPYSFTFFIFVEKNAFFNILYSYFSRSLHPWKGAFGRSLWSENNHEALMKTGEKRKW